MVHRCACTQSPHRHRNKSDVGTEYHVVGYEAPERLHTSLEAKANNAMDFYSFPLHTFITHSEGTLQHAATLTEPPSGRSLFQVW